jgi:drug/metabolite transporter (DMT)-like permease
MGFLWSDKIGGVVSVELVATFTGWLALNLGLNYYNKWVLSETDFRFPFFLTLVNKSVGLCVAITALFFKEGLPKPQDLAAQFSRPIVHAYGVMTALNIGMNNWSLLLITLTLNQIIKATIPLPTALLSKLVEGKTFSWHLYGSMAVLVGGVVMSSVGAFGAEVPSARSPSPETCGHAPSGLAPRDRTQRPAPRGTHPATRPQWRRKSAPVAGGALLSTELLLV